MPAKYRVHIYALKMLRSFSCSHEHCMVIITLKITKKNYKSVFIFSMDVSENGIVHPLNVLHVSVHCVCNSNFKFINTVLLKRHVGINHHKMLEGEAQVLLIVRQLLNLKLDNILVLDKKGLFQ